ncbi:DUF6268 family outer membrane beta-barrel protein [Gilvibacter sediminis]|uniref:DUF6268 family outer membrane beta-barrel protein n=1 Tax=Gilvibacter sediminis TaxID=379071 RepID=UPI002350C91F|nr:DUF6268 family outer membrane beta-barrel protein [Gilvibacter sediminis]MDC7999310.1 DUF6268 family outer membrane beta-barrel protein [Gilvibacter sediminis]
MRKFLLLLLIISGGCCLGQSTDLMRVEWLRIPQVDSDNSLSRFRGFINFPIPLSWEGSYLIPGFEYRHITLDIDDPVPFDTNDATTFEMFRATIAYTFKFKSGWRFGARAGFELASNFESADFLGRDFRFSGSAYMIRDRSEDEVAKPNRWVIGLQYSTNQGRPLPLPIINYYRQFHPSWSYSLGTPKTNIKHMFNAKNSIQAYVSLDGFFSNLQNNRVVTNPDGSTSIADNISMTQVLGGLGYEYNFAKNFYFYLYAAYTLYNELRLRDENRNNVFNLNENNTGYFRTGVKFKI